MNNIFYVYKHIRQDTGIVFYIGKGKGYRKSDLAVRNKYHKNIVKKAGIKIEIIKDNLSEEQAFELEKKLIKEYKDKGYCKANLSDGGTGGASGCIRSEKTRKKISLAKKGVSTMTEEGKRKHSKRMSGRIVAESTRQKLSRIRTKNPTMLGKKHTEGYKKMMSDRMANGSNPSAKKVIDKSTGIIFSSIKEAAQNIGINTSTLRGYINGSRPNKTSLMYHGEDVI